MGWYIGIGVLVLVSLMWDRIEARLRPAHFAALKAGCKCVRCGQPISEGETRIPAEGHSFGFAHLECEKSSLAGAGCNLWFLTVAMFFWLLVFSVGDLQRLEQGKISWIHAETGRRALFLIVAVVSARLNVARRRRRLDRFISRSSRKKNESEQSDR